MRIMQTKRKKQKEVIQGWDTEDTPDAEEERNRDAAEKEEKEMNDEERDIDPPAWAKEGQEVTTLSWKGRTWSTAIIIQVSMGVMSYKYIRSSAKYAHRSLEEIHPMTYQEIANGGMRFHKNRIGSQDGKEAPTQIACRNDEEPCSISEQITSSNSEGGVNDAPEQRKKIKAAKEAERRNAQGMILSRTPTLRLKQRYFAVSWMQVQHVHQKATFSMAWGAAKSNKAKSELDISQGFNQAKFMELVDHNRDDIQPLKT